MGHKIQMYENLRDVLEREVKDIERKNDITKESLDNLYKLTATLKYVDQCIKKEEEKEGGGSSMDGGYSNARGGRGGYSRNSYDSMSNEGGGSNMYPTPYALAQQERMRMMPNDRIREGMRMEGISEARGRSYDGSYEGGSYGGGSYGESYDSYEGGQSNARGGRGGGRGRSNEGGGSNDGMSGARRGRDGDSDGRYN